MSFGKTAQGLLQFGNCGYFIERRALAVVLAAILQMNVSILKTRQYQAPAGINNARGFSSEGADFSYGAQSRNPAIRDGQSRGAWCQGIHRADVGIDDDKFRCNQDAFSKFGQSGEGITFAGRATSFVQQKMARKGVSPIMVA